MQLWADTTALTDFLKGNLITILVTVIAINSATLAVLTSKMADISREQKKPMASVFENSLKQMKLSIKEMFLLILISILLLIFTNGQAITYRQDLIEAAIQTLFTFVFVYALFILHDTAMAIFSIHDLHS